MARTAANSDVYSAIAEPRRRAILELLCEADRAVNEVVDELGFDQPSVSKHLRVLREVDLVSVHRKGRQRIYSASAAGLQSVHDWVRQFERFWNRHLDSIQARAEAKQQKGKRR